jgi:hypothetical protein
MHAILTPPFTGAKAVFLVTAGQPSHRIVGMTDGQQRDQNQGSGEEFLPKPGQPTIPFRAIQQPPPAAGPDQQSAPSGYGYPQGGQPGGYGYPQQSPPAQSGYGYPQPPEQSGQHGQQSGQAGQAGQSGYGYPQHHAQQAQPDPHQQQSSGPAWAPPSAHLSESTVAQSAGDRPDWSALADRSEQEGKRRKLKLYGGALAVVVIAAIVATAVVVSGNHKTPSAGPTGNPTVVEPTPSFSDVTPTPPPDPLAVLSDPKRDTAPLSTGELFPGASMVRGAHHYTKAGTDSSTACAALAAGALPGVLEHYGCHRMLRATYYANGYAVTVGVAVFDSKTDADSAKAHAQPYLLPLAAGLGPFCHATACQSAANSVGRYAYFTIAGRIDRGKVTTTDPATLQIAGDVGYFTFEQLVNRGRAEASATTG